MRVFDSAETHRLAEIDGVELADFWQRAVAFLIDAFLALFSILMLLFAGALSVFAFRSVMYGDRRHVDLHFRAEDEITKIIFETLAPVLYFGLSTWIGNGRTVGKRLMGIRVVSLVHERMDLWHSIERALGYGAAALEFGFGFAQFFIHPYRRTVQDRIAETIVVKEKSLRLIESRSHAAAVSAPH
jgi:uncharacterized RDD family membrane protein YckC